MRRFAPLNHEPCLCACSAPLKVVHWGPRPIALFHRYYLNHVGWKRLSIYGLVICNFLFCPVGFLHPFGIGKPYGPNSPIHSSLCVSSFLQRWFSGDPRSACSYVNLLTKKRKRDTEWCLFLFSNAIYSFHLAVSSQIN